MDWQSFRSLYLLKVLITLWLWTDWPKPAPLLVIYYILLSNARWFYSSREIYPLGGKGLIGPTLYILTLVDLLCLMPDDFTCQLERASGLAKGWYYCLNTQLCLLFLAGQHHGWKLLQRYSFHCYLFQFHILCKCKFFATNAVMISADDSKFNNIIK